MNNRFSIRNAHVTDIPTIQSLIARSSRDLGGQYYSEVLVEAALKSVLGVDRQLITDSTYFLVEADDELVGCGGWSFRNTLYGSDAVQGRDDRPLDPARNPARIRAFFVDPVYARRGIASLILERCEREARDFGFRSLELGATLSGVEFYKARGFEPLGPIAHEVSPGLSMEIVPMRKILAVA